MLADFLYQFKNIFFGFNLFRYITVRAAPKTATRAPASCSTFLFKFEVMLIISLFGYRTLKVVR
ncbi:MAG: hypothetical protein P8Y60_04525, partial [Calditrichota bacterium]